MLAEAGDKNDVAIHWPNDRKRISAILRSGKCPSFGLPRQLRVPGGMVALVDGSGEVMLVFRVARIEEQQPIQAADGKQYASGCVLVARPGTMRRPGRRDPSVLSVNRNALGAFAYFDASSFERVVYETFSGGDDVDVPRMRPRKVPTKLPKTHSTSRTPRPFPLKRYPLFANNIGKTLSQPERELILAYTSWVGEVTMFAHHALKETGLFTDLFIPRRWTLIEAKSNVRSNSLREAVGQLFDYQRHYDRSPSLAVLLPERPSGSIMGLFEKKRITVIWRSRNAFRDTADGALTTDLRRAARQVALPAPSA